MSVYSVTTPRPLPETRPNSPPSITHLPTRHQEYYFEDGVIFLVENTLFRVPRYLLVLESPVFKDMFAMPTAHPEGKTDDAAIQLLQVKAVEFVRLLAVIYPLRVNGLEYATGIWEATEWTSVLHLATRWQMSETRKIAIKHLTVCASPVSKLILGRQYGYPSWIRDGFCDLCLRKDPLSIEEAIRLSKEDILGVSAARESIRARVLRPDDSYWERRESRYGEYNVLVTTYEDGAKYLKNRTVHAILDEVFSLEDTADVDGID